MKNRYQLSQTLQLSEIEKVYSITRPRYTYENEAEKYHVKIGTNPTCSCMYSSKSRAVCKHRLWVMLYVLNVPEESNVLQQVSLTTEEVKTVFSATVQAPTCNSTTQENESPQQTSTKSSQDTVSTQDIFSKHPMYQQPQVWKLSIFMKRSGKLPVCAGCRKNTIDDKQWRRKHETSGGADRVGLRSSPARAARKFFSLGALVVKNRSHGVSANQYWKCSW